MWRNAAAISPLHVFQADMGLLGPRNDDVE
jgi:hypothetical protein